MYEIYIDSKYISLYLFDCGQDIYSFIRLNTDPVYKRNVCASVECVCVCVFSVKTWKECDTLVTMSKSNTQILNF